jgi:ABC-type Mn2+/Zn2+ transport system permease subunit
LVAPSVPIALALATVFGALSGGIGYILSFRFALPVGASQAATAVLLVVVTAAFRTIRERITAAQSPYTSMRPTS